MSPLLWLLAVALLTALPVSADVIWRGDFETGTTEQWPGAPKSDGVKVVTEPVRAGKYSLRIDGTNAARTKDLDRIEFQHQPKPPGTAEGRNATSAGAFSSRRNSRPAVTRSDISRRGIAGANSWRSRRRVRHHLHDAGALRSPLDRQGQADTRSLARFCRPRALVA